MNKENILFFSIWILIVSFFLVYILQQQKDQKPDTPEVKLAEELLPWFCCPKIIEIGKTKIIIELKLQPQYYKSLSYEKRIIQLNYSLHSKSINLANGTTNCYVSLEKPYSELGIIKEVAKPIDTIILYLSGSLL